MGIFWRKGRYGKEVFHRSRAFAPFQTQWTLNSRFRFLRNCSLSANVFQGASFGILPCLRSFVDGSREIRVRTYIMYSKFVDLIKVSGLYFREQRGQFFRCYLFLLCFGFLLQKDYDVYFVENFLKIFLVLMAIISDIIPENKTTVYSYPLQISNRMPYNALPNGCAHMETVRMTAITFPIRF